MGANCQVIKVRKRISSYIVAEQYTRSFTVLVYIIGMGTVVCCLDYSYSSYILCVACQKVIRPKLKPATTPPAPFVRQMSIPVTRAHVYQTQFAQNKSAHVNGDVGPTSKSNVSLTPASSVAMISQVSLSHSVAGELIAYCVYLSKTYFVLIFVLFLSVYQCN